MEKENLKNQEDQNYDSDSSGGLPELFPKKVFDITKLEKNEIVWAKFKDLFWPALVRSVDKKGKKVRVWYLDAPGKCFKVPFNKIQNFCDACINIKHREEAKLTPYGKKHDDLFKRTLMFIDRKSCGIGDDPAEFFDPSNEFYLLKNVVPGWSGYHYKSKNSSNKKKVVSEESSEGESLDESEEESCAKPPDKNGAKSSEESSEGESRDKSEEESCAKPPDDSKTKDVPKPNYYDDETVAKILAFILAGQADKHLLDIANSKISSERHDLFVQATESNQMTLLWHSPANVPIDNVKLLDALIYLTKLYKKKFGVGRCRTNDYCVEVWLPESVKFAISSLNLTVDKVPSVNINGLDAKTEKENGKLKRVHESSSESIEKTIQNPDLQESEACTSTKKKLKRRK